MRVSRLCSDNPQASSASWPTACECWFVPGTHGELPERRQICIGHFEKLYVSQIPKAIRIMEEKPPWRSGIRPLTSRTPRQRTVLRNGCCV